jgi:hypothetical protein
VWPHLYVDGPLQATGQAERETTAGILHIPQQKQIKEEPTNHIHQLTVATLLTICHRVLRKGEGLVNPSGRGKGLTPGGRMVKLKKRPTFFLYNERDRSLVMAVRGEKASLTAMVMLSLQFESCFLM